MSITDRPGQLGGQDIYLRNDRPAPYVRSKIPVTPQRADIEGDTGGVAPDPYLRHWSQEDFSAGAGYPLWDVEKTGFDKTSGVVWNAEDQVLQPGPRYLIDDTFTDGGPFYVRDGRVVTVGNAATNKVSFGTTDASPTWATDGFSVKAASTPHAVDLIYDTVGAALKVVSSYSNGDVYLDAVLWGNVGTSGASNVLTSFQGQCYVMTAATTLDVMDGFGVATSTTKVTTPPNLLHAETLANRWLTSSDVGPCWLVKDYSEKYEVWEYNVADDTEDVLAALPLGVLAESLLYAFDGYWVPYATVDGHSGSRKEAWLWFLVNGVQGRVGPFVSDTGIAAATEAPKLLGTTDRNEIVFYWSEQVWAYNVEDTSANLLIDTSLDTVSGSTGVDYGFAHGDFIGLVHDNAKVAVYERSGTHSDATAKNINLGAWDGGYPGVKKQLASVTVSTEPLAANTRVLLAYRFDQASSWNGMTTVHDVDGATSFTWYPSQQFAAQSGDLVQLQIRLENSGVPGSFEFGPYVKKVSAAVVPDEAFIEFDLEIDLGDDRAGRLDSQVTADLLWDVAYETTFVDPWSVREHAAAETHNVRVVERSLGPVGRDGPQYARVKLRKVERV